METSVGPIAIDRRMVSRALKGASAAAWLLFIATHPAGAAPERLAGGAFQFSATVGGGQVLLRWTNTERPSPYPAFLLMKRSSSESSFSVVGPSPILPMTDPNEIDAVFPALSKIRAEVELLLIDDVGPTLPLAILALRAAADPARRMQREMLLNSNYGMAIVEGLAYLDADVVSGTKYEYELWGVDLDVDPDDPAERLGKLWVAAGIDTKLPAPVVPPTVEVLGEKGDSKIYLKWDTTPSAGKDRETKPTGFGYDIYRKTGTSDPNAVIPDPPAGVPIDDPNSGAVKINKYPIFPQPGSDQALPDFFFVDAPGDPAIDPNVPPVVKGKSYKYWIVARDLLKQHGTFSAARQACAPDRGKPRQVAGVTAKQVPGAGVVVSWKANTSDPNTVEGGSGYVDDTAGYNVYRYTDFEEMLDPPDPNRRVAANLPGTVWTDPAPAIAANQGKIYWYVVTAVDTAVCNNTANESAFSAPARGVYYDLTPPVLAGADPYCQSSQNTRCVRDCGMGGPPCASDPYCPGDPNHPNNPAYPSKMWCKCGGASGIWPLPLDGEWGYRVKSIDTAPDAMSVRLYRGVKEKDYRPVAEGFLETSIVNGLPWVGYRSAESFRSVASQKLDYKVRALDKDSNLGPSRIPDGFFAELMPAFVAGAPPMQPTIVESIFTPGGIDPRVGTLTVRWHAPGAEALAGFLLRLGSKEDASAGTFTLLPQGNLFGEPFVDAAVMLDPGVCDPDHDLKVDLDGDGVDPRDILITGNTEYLADLLTADPTLGGLRDPATGYFQHTFGAAVLDPGTTVEVQSVDIAGQLSASARRSDLAVDADPNSLRWPERPMPGAFPLVARYDVFGVFVELCWDQNAHAAVASEVPAGNPEHIAVFRSVLESGVPRGYRQRSPLLDISAYMGGNPPLNCSSDCIALVNSTNLVDPSPACWWDHGVTPGFTYNYTVLGFEGPPGPGQLHRHEREIQAAFGPLSPGIGACAMGVCP